MKISIITPSFQQGQFIERTIQSVLTQNVADLEYWVMDGGSQDKTVAILEQYAGRLHFVSEPDQGQAHAVNKGLRQSSGDIIGWLNSDDIYYPGVLNTVLAFFTAHPEIDILYGQANHIDEQDIVLERYPSGPWDVQRLTKTCYLSQPAVFWRRRVMEQFGYLDESLQYCMDYEYWLRLALAGVRAHYLDVVLAGSRLYPATKTMRAPLAATEEALSMLQRSIAYVPAQWLLNYAVLATKNKIPQRFPHPRFLFQAWFAAASAGFRWNGIGGGLRACYSVPLTMLKIQYSRRFGLQACKN